GVRSAMYMAPALTVLSGDAAGNEYDTLRCTCCLFRPYMVVPRGLYTDKVTFTSNARRAAPESPRTWICSRLTSTLEKVGSLTMFAKRRTGCMCINKRMVAKIVITNFTRTQ